MYDDMTSSKSVPGSLGAQQEIAGKPLSMELTERTRWAADTARQARFRLVELKDRIFGALPTTGGADKANQASSESFAMAWRNSQDELEAHLAAIDSLSSEIANRF